MSQTPAFDASIPVLTEVFVDKPDQPPPAPVAPPEPEAIPPEVEAEGAAPALIASSEPDWDVLEQRLAERIVLQLRGQVDHVLEETLRDSVEQALRRAVEEVSGDLRRAVRQTIESTVAGAVAREIADLRAAQQ